MNGYRGVIFITLMLFVGFFATFHLKESPSFWFDEGWYFQTSANLATVGIDGIQMAPGDVQHVSTFVTVGYPLIYPLAGWFKAFGISVTSARSLMVLFILSFIIASYVLARRLFGGTVALGVLALLASFPPLYGNGKSVLGEVPGLLYLVLFLLCFNLLQSDVRRKYLWLVLSGIFIGLCVATKPLFLVLAAPLLIVASIGWRRGTFSGKDIGLGLFFALVPIALWFIIQFRTGASISETLTFYVNPYHISNLQETILQNLKRLFSDVGTLYTVFLMSVWSLGLWLRRKLKKKISYEELVAFTFCILIVIAYLRTVGVYRYLFPAQAVALIFFPSALLTSAVYVGRNRFRYLAHTAYTTLIVLLFALGVYQLAFNSWVADSYTSHKTAFWENYFAQTSSSTIVFFYNTPEVTPFSQSRNYYQYIQLFDRALGDKELPILTSGKADVVITQTDAYTNTKDDLFKAYIVQQTAYKYTILEKR